MTTNNLLDRPVAKPHRNDMARHAERGKTITAIRLSEADQKLIASINERQAQISTHVDMVGRGYRTAAFIYGPGGHGKTDAIRKTLEQHPGPRRYVYHAGSATAVGLFESLKKRPECIHWFEECEPLFKDQNAACFLRSACGAPDQTANDIRRISRAKFNCHDTIDFRGGIVVASNENLADDGIFGAVASRFSPVEWALDHDEMIAMFRSIAVQGWSDSKGSMSPQECMEVAEWLIEMMRQAESKGQFTLRTLCENAFPNYMYHRDIGGKGLSWQDAMRSVVIGKATCQTIKENRDQRHRRLQRLAAEIEIEGTCVTQRNELWRQRSASSNDPAGLAQAARYRWLDQAKESGVFDQVRSEKAQRLESEKVINGDEEAANG